MTSYSDRPHLRRPARNPRAGLCIDIERPARQDGQRPNLQVRAVGQAALFDDAGGAWTQRIDEKYGSVRSAARVHDRVVMRLVPERRVAVASV